MSQCCCASYPLAPEAVLTAIHLSRRPNKHPPPRHTLRARNPHQHTLPRCREVAGTYRDVHEHVQGVVSRWIGVKNRVESRLKSRLPLMSPSSPAHSMPPPPSLNYEGRRLNQAAAIHDSIINVKLDIITPPLNVCKWSLRWIENSQVRGGDELQNSDLDADGLAVIWRPAHGATGGADVRLERGRRVGEEDFGWGGG
ncbi:hypothetical protein DFH08DRAFT_942236 [Mycena albidolilacea]|uniref:Uncharacterized protein n=1 Tax=Mycena albidolilacea TaxID=1033008 RepID=A0AAD6ZEP2_9AGAR|nr:hypothetical protein DFH08DRAFT_942236 [Mycena albidolilacea]